MSVRLEVIGHTGVITLDSPATRNAFTPELREQLAAAIEAVKTDDEVRAVVITGSAGAFSAGGDVKGMALAPIDPPVGRARMHATQKWMRELITLEKPVIAAVDGPAYGAGFSIALAADIVVATPRARFCMVFLRIGLIPDCGAFYLLPRVVGAQRARELMLSAREVQAQEAKELGIVMELHEHDDLLPRAMAIAASFAHASPIAVSIVKRSTANTGELDAVLDAEANAQALLFSTPAHKDAVKRFIEKQPLAFHWPTYKEKDDE
ncbi:enoyl-CoA hydratase/isomerase family protein [Ramlibacter albus]|uniref:Enoyl-CoA hydratase/isomerase family protein n=1 Tax=Ramlibacter albus TaxID=2079448 RepID=A0A923MAI8_9BURK|nr:enoyl-CoA hydratase/isomerase family protein [Ramlibacter albus]MBC5765779.1 enoyl-CoA hydratase/isomerase family protein [Ramlibacter albus]